jgi:Carboxypeptidase regulatory-like domain
MAPDFTARKMCSARTRDFRLWGVDAPDSSFGGSSRSCGDRLGLSTASWRRMAAQTRTKPFAWAALLLIAGAMAPCRVPAQPANGFGSLAGRLTDTHSSPLANVTVILRNASTGFEITATTSRGGRYAFARLAAGEYTMTAAGTQGNGQVGGIVISADHEARVQAVIEFTKPQTAVVFIPEASSRSAEQQSSSVPAPPIGLRDWSAFQVSAPALDGPILLAEMSFAPEVLLALPLSAKTEGPLGVSAPRNPVPDRLAKPAPVSGSPASAFRATIDVDEALEAKFAPESVAIRAQLDPKELVTVPAAVLGVRTIPKAKIAAAEADPAQQNAQTLDSAQIEALPLRSRDWKSFLAGVPPANEDTEDHPAPSGIGAPQEITIDGAHLQSAFADTSRIRGGSALTDSGIGESAIRELVPATATGDLSSAHCNSLLTGVVTQQGTERLHGQVFILDRQDLWGAQNPFTQWVQETAPAFGSIVPVFTAAPYSPPDREALWGVGLGGVLRHPHLLWFGALDGYRRDDPGVATVKHPDNFFAQPANDQMQLLSAQLGLSGVDPVGEGVAAYSKLLESLAALLGPAQRTSMQWTGFGRLDWNAGDRQRFTLETSGTTLDSPGGGFTRASETFGSHSFGSVHASEKWLIARWEAFVTPNLLAVTQGSIGHLVQSTLPETPSAFEQSLNISAWGQLPQIVVDSRYGFTIGNPARFGRGSYPDEHLYMGQEQLNWVHGNLMLKSGFELRHDGDATTQLRNQTGTYYYSGVESFASDALAFSAFGLNGQLNPMDQHNCDQRGKAWRDSAGVLHGLGYLPCYSYYSQTMGPSDWWLSTNDWASYTTAQWQPNKSAVFTVATRWELEQLPPPMQALQNPDLPLTERLPGLGSQWGPRAGFAWGTGESHWPVLRLGYGMYFGRMRNSVVETALTQTGSLKGDLNFFMRPTDNLNGGGAPPFPYALAGEPPSVVKPGAVEFAPGFRNGEVHQGEVSVEEGLPGRVRLEAGAIGSLGRRLPVTLDANIDPATNPKTITYAVIDGNASGPIKSPQITVPFFASWPSATSATGFSGRLDPNYQQVSEMFSRANSTYEALVLHLSRNARALTLHARYTYAHAMDWNPDETSQLSGPSVLDPIDFRQEYGTSNLDIRHSLTTVAILQPKWNLNDFAGHVANGWMLSGVGYFHGGLPYTMRTSGSLAKEFDLNGTPVVALSTGMNGYGGDNRVYGIGRNTYRYPATWKADLRVAKHFNLGQMRQLELMAESFNLFNHQNVTELETVGYSIESGTVDGSLPMLNFLTGLKSGQTEFGKPLNINATDFYRERQLQFGARMRF